MTIQNRASFLASVWDWGPLRPCFLRGIEPTDIDGWVEVGGYFLVLEGKAPDVPLKEGQRANFERMLRWNETIPGLFTIIVIWGDASIGRIDHLQFWPSAPFAGGWDALREYIKAWAETSEERGAAVLAKSKPQPKLHVVDPAAFRDGHDEPFTEEGKAS